MAARHVPFVGPKAHGAGWWRSGNGVVVLLDASYWRRRSIVLVGETGVEAAIQVLRCEEPGALSGSGGDGMHLEDSVLVVDVEKEFGGILKERKGQYLSNTVNYSSQVEYTL